MNLVKIHYSGKEMEVEIPEDAQFDVLRQSSPPEAMNSGEIREFVERVARDMPERGVTLVMNDHNRATRTDAVLKAGWKFFKRSIERVIIATGSHAPPTPEHLIKMLGEDLYSALKDKIQSHLALEDKHENVGETSRGTEVLLMKDFLSSKHLLYINSVEPHYFAGFTGGRKSILPGVSHYSTIEHNHSFALMPEAKTLALEGNPVHEDMMEAIGFVDIPHTSIQIVQSPEGGVLNLFAGDIKGSFYRAAERAKDVFTTPVDGLYDVVVAAVPPPMDLNLYQSQKGIENGKLALKKGGILILMSSCREGIGPEKFWNLLTQEATPGGVLERIREGYKLGYHKAAKIAEFVLRNKLWAVTDIDPAILKKGFIKGYRGADGVRDALREAFYIMGEDARVLYIPDATMMVPNVEER